MMRTSVRGLLLVAGVSSLVGCTSNLDMEKVKASITEGIKTQVGATPKSVSCPEQRAAKAEDTFECTVTLEVGSVPVMVSQKDASGSISWELKQTILKIADLEKLLVPYVKEQTGADASVDCGPRFRASKPADVFECSAKIGSETEKVKVTVKDGQGNVTWAMATPPADKQEDAPKEE